MKDFFRRLKYALHLPKDTKLHLVPAACKYRGVVSKDGKDIFIFDSDKETLLHETIDLLITKLLVYRGGDIYEVKEAVVEIICSLISPEKVVERGSIEEIIDELQKRGFQDLVE